VIPIHKYVDTTHPNFKGKSGRDIWYMLHSDAKLKVIAEFVADVIREEAAKIREEIVKIRKKEVVDDTSS